MKKNQLLILDGKKRKILFRGKCLNVLNLCQAMCCREWAVSLSNDEFNSGKYKTKKFCVPTNKDCLRQKADCLNIRYEILRKKDGSCIYLTQQNRCAVYHERPQVCRDFSCRNGWRLSFVVPAKNKKRQDKERRQGVTGFPVKLLKETMHFLPNPLIKLKTIFYSPKKKEVFLVMKAIGICELVRNKEDLKNPKINDSRLWQLFCLFDGKSDLAKVFALFNKTNGGLFSWDEFCEIAGLFCRQNLLMFKNPL